MYPGDQDGYGGTSIGDVQRVLIEAEQVVGARLAAAQQFVGVGGIDANLVAMLLERPHCLLQMRKRRIRQAAEVDDIGALVRVFLRARQDVLDGQAPSRR